MTMRITATTASNPNCTHTLLAISRDLVLPGMLMGNLLQDAMPHGASENAHAAKDH
jgi:hypothetical protein